MLSRRRIFIILSIMLLSVFVFVGCNKTKESVKKAAEVTKAETEKKNTTTEAKKNLTEAPTDKQQQTSNETEQQTTLAETEAATQSPIEATEPPTPTPTEATEPPTPTPTKATEPPTPAPIEATEPPTPTPTKATEPPTPAPTEAPAPSQNSGTSDFSKEAAMESLNLQNQKRAEVGLAPLSWNEELYNDIMVRGKEIKEVFAHERPDGSSCFSAVTVEWHTIGENIAYGYQSAQAVTEGWYNSQGHRENMLNENYTSAAVVCYQNIYWVTMFIG